MKEFYRRHLPHWQPVEAVFFVIFRLKNSLPFEVIGALREKRERAAQTQLDQNLYFERWEGFLDKEEFGPRWLAQPDIAEIVKDAMHYRDRNIFDLHAFCIMPNHVHVVIEPISKSGCQPELPKILQSLKRHTARQANLILGREGAFWQDESYDHVIRDNEEYTRIIHYVLENPVKAGLVSTWKEWRWTYHKPETNL
jgi:REP element-mobilizing transposase RayT